MATSGPVFGLDFGPISGLKNGAIFFTKKQRRANQKLLTQHSKITPYARLKMAITAPPDVAKQLRNIGRIWCYKSPASTPPLAKARARSLTCCRAGACGHARKTERAHTHTHTHSHNVRTLSLRRSTERAPCEYEGRVQNQGRIMVLKNGPCLDTVLARRCNKFPALVSLKGGCKSKRHGASAATMITYRGFPQQIVECEAHTADASSGPQILQKHKALHSHELKHARVAAASATPDRKRHNDAGATPLVTLAARETKAGATPNYKDLPTLTDSPNTANTTTLHKYNVGVIL